MRYNVALSRLICLVILFSYACKPDIKLPDVSHISLDNQFIRYDHQFNNLSANDIDGRLEALAKDYPAFTELYLKKILPLKPSTDIQGFNNAILDFLQDKDVKQVNDTINEVFVDANSLSKGIAEALKYYQYYFPESKVPNIYTFTSYFGYQSFIFPDVDRDGVALGLDMFLGTDFPYKAIDPQNPVFSEYLTRFYTPKQIPKKVIEQIIDDKLGAPAGNKFIDHMIHHGKKLYLMNLCLPKLPANLIHEYTEDQMIWCEENETGIWTYLVDKEMLYGSNSTMINRYTRPAPSSRNMPPESPGRTANFVGLKIVEAYMKAYPDTSINDLMSMTDGTQILQASKYKPPRI